MTDHLPEPEIVTVFKCGDGTEFPVKWDHPADGERHWRFDPTHSPDVLTPLGFDLYYGPFIRGFSEDFELILSNYYAYISVNSRPPAQAPRDEELRELANAWSYWRNNILPEVEEYIRFYRQTAFDPMSSADLVAGVDRLLVTRHRQGQLHSQAMRPWIAAMRLLTDT